MSGESLSVKEIADFMGRSEVFVRGAIENGSLPIGCYTRNGSKGSYYISPKRAKEYLGYEKTSYYNSPVSDVRGIGS